MDELLSKLNLNDIEKIFNNLSKEEQTVLGGNFKDLLKNLTNGTNVSIEKLAPFALQIFLSVFKKVLPTFILLLGIILISSILNGAKSDFATKSVHSVINFASASIIGAVLCYSLIDTFTESYNFIKTIFSLTQAIFPLIFSILITMGAGTSATIFQGSLSLFLSLFSVLISSFILPLSIFACILSIITNVTTTLKLGKIPEFMTNTAKKTISSIFIVFSSLLALQGISAQVYDSVGIRITKFSLSKYIPILGGYLSSGFDFLYAGSVLLKNSIGIAFILILLITLLPILLKLICVNFLTDILSLVSTCVGNESSAKMLKGIKQSVSLIIGCIIGLSLTLIVFIVMTVTSFNSLV
jgi:stage III sporulation protein AE